MWTFASAAENSKLMSLWRVCFSIKSKVTTGSLGKEGLLCFVRMLFKLYKLQSILEELVHLLGSIIFL